MTEEQANKKYVRVSEHIKNFISLIEKFYAPYTNNIVRFFIAMDLKDFNAEQLRELFDLIRREYSRVYKSPPDTKLLMDAWDKRYKQSGLKCMGNYCIDANNNVFDKLLKQIGHYDSGRFIPNLTSTKMRKKVLTLGPSKISPKKYLEYRDEIEGTKEIIVRGK